MLTIALTGGIGCGKSTAAQIFESLQVPVIDADRIAHDLVRPGQPTLDRVLQCFGQQFARADGNLDRDALRARVFSDADSRRQLEAIMHPAIRDEMQRLRQQLHGPYCILVIPLLVESGQQELCDRILVIDCQPQTQRTRVLKRPGVSAIEFEAIIQAQCSRSVRLAAADDVITNDADDIDALKEQILVLHQQYLKMSRNA